MESRPQASFHFTAAWLRAMYMPADTSVDQEDLYHNYCQYCSNSHLSPMTMITVTKCIKKVFNSETRRCRRKGGDWKMYKTSYQNITHRNIENHTTIDVETELKRRGFNVLCTLPKLLATKATQYRLNDSVLFKEVTIGEGGAVTLQLAGRTVAATVIPAKCNLGQPSEVQHCVSLLDDVRVCTGYTIAGKDGPEFWSKLDGSGDNSTRAFHSLGCLVCLPITTNITTKTCEACMKSQWHRTHPAISEEQDSSDEEDFEMEELNDEDHNDINKTISNTEKLPEHKDSSTPLFTKSQLTDRQIKDPRTRRWPQKMGRKLLLSRKPKDRESHIRAANKKLTKIFDDHSYAIPRCKADAEVKESVYGYGPGFEPCEDFFDIVGEAESHCELCDLEGHSADEFNVVTKTGVVKNDENEDSDHIYGQSEYDLFRETLKDVKHDLCKDTGFVMLDSDTIQFVDIYSSDNPGIRICLTVCRHYKCSIKIHRKDLPADHVLWRTLPKTCASVELVRRVLELLSKQQVCVGNYDPHFVSQLTTNQSTASYIDEDIGATHDGFRYQQTVRHMSCLLLVRSSGSRCIACSQYRGTSRKRKSLANHEQTNSTETPKTKNSRRGFNHKYMSRDQLIDGVCNLNTEIKTLKMNADGMRKYIDKLMTQGEKISESENSDISDMVSEFSDEMNAEFPEGSFERLFWEEQIKDNKLKSKTDMRWHPIMIKWCHLVKSKSTKAYGIMNESGFTHKQDLVYDRHTGEIVGYVDPDKTGNHLTQF